MENEKRDGVITMTMDGHVVGGTYECDLSGLELKDPVKVPIIDPNFDFALTVKNIVRTRKMVTLKQEIAALKLSIRLWTWIVNNPDKNKTEWKHYGLINKSIDLPDCPLCQLYFNTLLDIDCSRCCLRKTLGRSIHPDHPCVEEFYKWWDAVHEGDYTISYINAVKILDAMKDRLEEIQGY